MLSWCVLEGKRPKIPAKGYTAKYLISTEIVFGSSGTALTGKLAGPDFKPQYHHYYQKKVCARFSSIYTLKKKEKFLLNFR
jgi:hypothetical protein